ncbi:alpha-ribazole phosphatase family protein [Cocleimonas flava]|uniref:phosphoglycerate mutase (2,3-diphosphoglycerate-dependent) n=1 Tax=Cocleimonas flava TaxID=634765 RepID=A0A4R1F868_9GAMM|nr:histidine phosphatase family protein [Cocleimonas flava]TCJ86901.1 alpha-ribazole phosphatase [Cocleimonas flava]
MTPTTTIIDLLRHGEVENDAVFCGSTNDTLTDAGWQKMVKALDNKGKWDLIVSASLERCQEFAQLIAEEDDIDLEVDDSLNEMDFGHWEGLCPEQIMKEEGELLNAWWQSPTRVSPPEGEDFHIFQSRVLAYFKNIIENNQGKRILFVSDTGPIRLIIMYILGMQDENLFRLNVDYACFSRLHIYHDEVGEKGCLIKHG